MSDAQADAVHPAIVQSIKDHEHLRILSKLYLVEAGIQILVGGVAACLGLFGGFIVLSDHLFADVPPAADMMRRLGWIIILLAGLLTLAAWTQAFLDFIVSRALTSRTRRKFCILVATGECIFVPFGTILAISTFLVLTRPSVRLLFDPPR